MRYSSEDVQFQRCLYGPQKLKSELNNQYLNQVKLKGMEKIFQGGLVVLEVDKGVEKKTH